MKFGFFRIFVCSYSLFVRVHIHNGTQIYHVKFGLTNDHIITKLIISFELSKNCDKIKVPSVMMRTDELGNIG